METNQERFVWFWTNPESSTLKKKKQPYDHSPPISQTIQVKREKHVGHF